MVKTANSTTGSLISSEGSLLCTDTCNGKVNYPHEKKYPKGEICFQFGFVDQKSSKLTKPVEGRLV